TAAFRPLETVGFPLRTPLRAILLSTTILISGLHHAACILAPSSFVPPLLGVHVEFATDRLAKLWSGGTCTVPGAHPLGNNNQFHGFSPTPKVSGLPWRDQCFVRCGTARRPGSGTTLRLPPLQPCPHTLPRHYSPCRPPLTRGLVTKAVPTWLASRQFQVSRRTTSLDW